LPGFTSQALLSACVKAHGPVRKVLEFLIEVNSEASGRAVVRSVATLDAHQSLLHFEETVLECPPLRGDAWTNNLAVGIIPYAAGAAVKRAYFNVLETCTAKNIFSPNLLGLTAAQYQLLLVNVGNQFYRRDGEEIRNILVFENEPGRCFAHAVGYATGNQISAARSSVQPVFVAAVNLAGTETIAPLADVTNFESRELVRFDSDDIELLSCRYDSGRYLLRLASLIDQAHECTLTFFSPIHEAYRTDLRGVRRNRLAIDGLAVKLRLQACDIQQIEIVTGG
jgi:hypothetical protein